MNKSFWNEAWELNRIGFHQEEINSHLKKYYGHFSNTNSTFFIPLCGKSKDMDWISSKGHHVTGVEIIEKAITDFFEERGISPDESVLGDEGKSYHTDNFTIYHQDFFQLKHPPFLNIYDRGSLIALPQTMREDYARKIIELTSLGSQILLITLSYDQELSSGPPFSVPPKEVEHLFSSKFQVTTLQNSKIQTSNGRFKEAGITEMNHHVLFLNRNKK